MTDLPALIACLGLVAVVVERCQWRAHCRRRVGQPAALLAFTIFADATLIGSKLRTRAAAARQIQATKVLDHEPRQASTCDNLDARVRTTPTAALACSPSWPGPVRFEVPTPETAHGSGPASDIIPSPRSGSGHPSRTPMGHSVQTSLPPGAGPEHGLGASRPDGDAPARTHEVA